MPTTLDPLIGTDWLHTKLLADAVLADATTGLVKRRIYIDKAPALVYPYGVIQALAGVPALGLGGIPIQLNSVYMVKWVTSGNSYTPIRAAANRAVIVLNQTMGTTATGQVFSCVLDDVLMLPERDDQANLDLRNIVQRWRLALA